MLVTFASQILSNFCTIPALYAKIPTFNADIYLFSFRCDDNIRGRVLVGCLFYLSNSARVMRGREGGGMLVAIVFVQVCVKNYSGARFIVPSQGPIPNISFSPGPAGD